MVSDGSVYRNQYTYEHDRLKTVSHNTTSDSENDVSYTFNYDAAGRPLSVQVGSQTLSETQYNQDTTVESTTFGNGGRVANTYDSFKRVTGTKIDADTAERYTYDYGAHGEIARVTDLYLNRRAVSEYDLANRPMRITHTEGSGQGGNPAHLYTGEVAYDAQSNLQAFKEKVGATKTPYESTYSYDNENRPTAVQYGGANHQTAYSYDAIGRISSKTQTLNNQPIETTYAYEDGGHGEGSTTPLVKRITQQGRNLYYDYDAVGNIIREGRAPGRMFVKTGQGLQVYGERYYYATTSVGVDYNMPFFVPPDPALDMSVTYAYDRLGQLKRANNPSDKTAGQTGTTWVYAYDRGGNILNKKAYVYTEGSSAITTEAVLVDTYIYSDSNWKDKLTAYNGVTISYDQIGNPLNDGTWQYTWQAGRQLKGMVKVGAGNGNETGAGNGIEIPTGTNIQYAYNADGLRVKKIVTDTQSGTTTTTHYTLHGKNIVHLTQGNNSLHFYYDAQNRVSQVDFNGMRYAYLHNLQGDVIAIVDQSGASVVEYSYDAWGKPIQKAGTLASTLGTLNPFRYRGYTYDEETGLYYLRSRYYNPEWCRFVNADTHGDSLASAAALNLYAYCGNRPVSTKDGDGTNIFSDIGNFFAAVWDGMEQRSRAMTADRSFYNIANWLTMGATGANYERGQEAISNPTFYNVGNYFSSGSFDMVKGAVAPEEPLSLSHWMCSAGVVAMTTPIAMKVSKAIPVKSPALRNPLANATSSPKLNVRMTDMMDKGHYFNTIVDNSGYLGTQSLIFDNKGVPHVLVEITGTYNKSAGSFEYILTLDNIMTHRLFRSH